VLGEGESGVFTVRFSGRPVVSVRSVDLIVEITRIALLSMFLDVRGPFLAPPIVCCAFEM
jgi:hypothetical protein